MKKNELQAGMIVTHRDGEKGMLFQSPRSNHYYIAYGYGPVTFLDNYTDDLCYYSNSSFPPEPKKLKPYPPKDIIDAEMPDINFVTGEQPYIPWLQFACKGEEPTAYAYEGIYTKMFESVEPLYNKLLHDPFRNLILRDPDVTPGLDKIIKGFEGIKRSVSDINWEGREG